MNDTLPSFTGTLRKVFGLPGQTIAEFKKELDALTPQDRADYHKILCDGGFPCKEP